MTDEEINVAIAGSVGWTKIRRGKLYRHELYGDHPEFGCCSIPNYCGDLNAMHEAASGLMFSARCRYHIALQDILSRQIKDGTRISIAWCIDATALERAEAFLRAKGLWKA